MTSPSEPSRQDIDDQLREMLKYLRLGRLLAHWEETLQKARQGRYSPERLLKYVVEEEYRAKRENARLLRRQRANIPEMWEMETFPFHKQPKLDRRRVMSLYDSFDYMTKQQGLIWLGPTGCGKTGLATAFLLQAIDRGYRGYFITFPELIQELFQASADRSDRHVFRRYLSYDCLDK
jgi:DNA replication protein DnaC